MTQNEKNNSILCFLLIKKHRYGEERKKIKICANIIRQESDCDTHAHNMHTKEENGRMERQKKNIGPAT